MSIYKDNPRLSSDFEIQPLELSFSIVTEKYRAFSLDVYEIHYSQLNPSPIQFLEEYSTLEQRLFVNQNTKCTLLGSSNTQHNCHLCQNTGIQGL